MTFYYVTNQGQSNLSDFGYLLKEALKLGGWQVTQSGTGTSGTFSTNSDLITSASVFNNTNAWYCIAHPTLDGYRRFFCIQVGSSGYQFRVKLSWTGFSTGSPSATRVPSAADEQVIWGSGTDASPTFVSYLSYALNDPVHNFIIGDVSEGYAFYAFTCLSATGGASSLMFMDKLSQTHPLDIDPYQYFMYGTNNPPDYLLNSSVNHLMASTVSNTKLYVWVRKGYSNQKFQKCNIGLHSVGAGSTNGQVPVGSIGSNVYDGKDMSLPMMTFVTKAINSSLGVSNETCYKGKSINVRLSCTSRISMDTSDSNTKIHFGVLIFPWNGTTPYY